MANVQVAGLVLEGEEHGLMEAHSTWRKEMGEQGDALLNISGVGTKTGVPVHKDTPRPAYVHQDYPRAMHHPDGSRDNSPTPNRSAIDLKHEKELIERGYRREPYPVVQVAIGDPKAEKVALQKELAEKNGQIATLQDQMAKLTELVQGLAEGKKGK